MLPLSGVRVVEFCQVLAGPYCGMLLADLGAEVIKVEPPEGDMMRHWPPISEGYSENFASINRNKRSVVLDLKDPAQKQAARQLILSADVVLENNRPGVMDRLGLGYESFRAEKPGLVYCSISAFGQSGPRSSEGGFDVTVQAMSGIMSVTGEPDGAPVKCGVPVSDVGTGLYAALTVVSILRRVAGGGPGAHDQRVLWYGPRPEEAGLGPSAQRALPGLQGGGRTFRDRRRQQQAVGGRHQGGWSPGPACR
jgi:crotonobetainyl-CoA:carnitine CoA-transferase CaiB-like acyl-CoA transferase